MEHLFGLASEYRCYLNRRYKTFVCTLHCALENEADLYVNECQKIHKVVIFLFFMFRFCVGVLDVI